MAMYALRLRRSLPLISSILNHHQRPLSSVLATPSVSSLTLNPRLAVTQSNLDLPFQSRLFRSSEIFLSSRPRSSSYNNNMDADHIDPDAILFEGCDYNHWLITMDFPKDPKPSAEEMVETYVQTAAKVLGSVEEAKKKIYACSTTTYQGFQVEVSEEVSEKFRGLPGVVFILPDSYIDPVNKEYGGDKYINGTIIPRPPPVQYGRQGGRYGDRNREFNRPPRGPMQPNPPPYQNNGAPIPMHNAPGGQGNYQGERRDPMPSYQGNYNQVERRNNYPPGQRDFPPQDQRNYPPPEQRDFRGDGRNYAPPQRENYRQGVGEYNGQSDGGNYGQRDGGNYAPPQSGSYRQGLGGNYGQRDGGNYAPLHSGNNWQGAGGNNVQGAGWNNRQGASGNYGEGVGGAHGREMGSGYSQSSPGYGEIPSFPQVEQRNNVQGQPGNYAAMEEVGTTQGRY